MNKILPLLLLIIFATQVMGLDNKRRKEIRDSLRLVRNERLQRKQTISQKPTSSTKAQRNTQSTPENVSLNHKGGSSEPSKPEAVAVELPISDTIMVESLNLKETDIQNLLQGLAVQYNLNVYVSPEVKGNVSVNFARLPLKSVIKTIVRENGFALSVNNGVIKVYRPKIKPKEKPKPKIKMEIDYKDGALSIDIENAPTKQVVRKLIELTGKTIVTDKGVKGQITSFFKNLKFDKGLRLLAQTNDMGIEEKRGIYTLYKQMSGAKGKRNSNNIWVDVQGDTVSIEAQKAEINEVISAISYQSGISTVVYGKLSGQINIKVKDIPINDALRYIFRDNEFTFWVNKGIYFIGPQKMQNVNNSRLIMMTHMKADKVKELIPGSLTKNTQINVVNSQNGIMVVGTYEQIEAISQYIEKIDLPIPQILIEALVVDIDMDKVREHGISMFIGDPQSMQSGGPEQLFPSFSQVVNKNQTESFLDGIPGLKDIVSLPKNFAAKIDALERNKFLKIRSKPQIATLNGQTATLTIGQTQYFLLKSATDINSGSAVKNTTTERFEKIEANVTLTVTPYVTGKNEVTCEILPDFTEPEGSFDASAPPTLNHRTMKSTVRLKDGETIILGGLVKESEQEVHNQVPLLGDIPILGWLFKNVRKVTSRSQLMIFVTPRIYYDSEGKVDVDEYMEKLEEF
ncbi:MAG: hypothetical protein OCD01_05545 [Fibrobacterales bacterium]